MSMLRVLLLSVMLGVWAAEYVPESLPYSFPTIDALERVPLISSVPKCKVSDTAANEILKIRKYAQSIAKTSEVEATHCEARRGYIQELTSFLNTWIVELNKLKRDLNQCDKFVKLSAKRIDELQQKEQLIKVEDVLECLTHDNQDGDDYKAMLEKQKESLQARATAITEKIKAVKTDMSGIIADKPAGEEE